MTKTKLMNRALAIMLLLFGTNSCLAQETNDQKNLTGFDWLTQFEGSWQTVTKSESAGN